MSNPNEKRRQSLYGIILHITVLLNFLDLVFSSLFIHFHGKDLEANLISRLVYQSWGMSGLILFKIITIYVYLLPMWYLGYSCKRYLISHIILWIFVYITVQHIIVFQILEEYRMLPLIQKVYE